MKKCIFSFLDIIVPGFNCLFPRANLLKQTWQGHNENGLGGFEETSGHKERMNCQPVGKADVQGCAPEK